MNKRYFFPLATFIICATVAFLYWQLIYLPLESEIAMLNAKTKEFEVAEMELEKLKLRYGNLEDLLERTEEKLIQAQNLLPTEMNTEKFIAELYEVATNKKISITSVQTGEISENKSVQSQSIKIRLDSDYISLLNFIREITDGERLASLENFSIAREDNTNILNCEVEFLIFAKNEKI